MRLARAATQELEKQVKEHHIQCNWSVDGKYQTATTDRGAEAMLEPFARELDALGEAYRWVEQDELTEKLGTQHFKRAVYTPGCVLMNPAALVRGLMDSLPENVAVFENSPVLTMQSANGITVTTPNGEVKSPRMILAANGYSDQFGFKPDGFVHLAARASLSKPMTPKEQANYAVSNAWGVTPANAFGGVTMRYTNDHRLLIRENISLDMKQNMNTQTTQKARKEHTRILRERFPSVPNLEFEDTWVGYLCMSKNGAPAFGQAAGNVWMAACQNGIGVTKGTISGLLSADLACGIDNPLITDIQALGTPDDLPARPIVEMGARVKMGWLKWKNRHES